MFCVFASSWGIDFLATQETNPDSDSHQHYNSKQYSAGVHRFLANPFCGENIDPPIIEFVKPLNAMWYWVQILTAYFHKIHNNSNGLSKVTVAITVPFIVYLDI